MYTLFCYCFHNICYTWTGLLFACFCSLLPKKAEVTRTCKSLVANSKGNLQRKRIAYWAMEKNVINCCYEINSVYISTIKIFVILCQRVCISVVRPRVCMLLLVSVKQVTNFMVAVKEPVVVFETKDGGFLLVIPRASVLEYGTDRWPSYYMLLPACPEIDFLWTAREGKV